MMICFRKAIALSKHLLRTSWVLALVAGGCIQGPAAPSLDLVFEGAGLAAWAANTHILYAKAGSGTSTDIYSYEPGPGETLLLGNYSSTISYFDIDATDRMLLGGIGGAYTFVKQDGTGSVQVTSLPDTTEGYLGLHVSSSGTQLALATLPPKPDLQVHRVVDGVQLFDHADLEGNATIGDLDWSGDDEAIYYGVNHSDQSEVSVVKIAPDGTNRTVIWQGDDVSHVERIFLSHDGSQVILSGRDFNNVTGVWLLALTGVVTEPTLLVTESGYWNRVAAGGGFSPDGTRFLLEVETPTGIQFLVQRLDS